jgi:hypothetical protein
VPGRRHPLEFMLAFGVVRISPQPDTTRLPRSRITRLPPGHTGRSRRAARSAGAADPSAERPYLRTGLRQHAQAEATRYLIDDKHAHYLIIEGNQPTRRN